MQRSACALFWLLFGCFTAVGAVRLGIGNVSQPGPGFIFFFAAALLIVLAFFDLAAGLLKRSGARALEQALWSGVRWQKVLLVLFGISVYICVFKPLGFFVSTFLLMIFLFKAVEPTQWWIAVPGGLVTILIVYAIFKTWLGVPFPEGLLGL